MKQTEQLDLLFKYHPSWLILTTVLAFGYAWFLYRKDDLLSETKTWIKWGLAGFRFISVWFILLLLLGVIIENFVERKEKPIVFIAHDNSESVVMTKDSTFYRSQYLTDLNSLSSDLANDYEIIEYSFSDVLDNGFSDTYDGKLTNISNVFDQIFEQYSNRNIGAIVLSSDGMYNAGANPVYAILQKSFIPVYTVGLGDTTEVKDLRLDLVNHNDIAFLGNQFPVEVALSQTKCKGEKVHLGIYKNDKQLAGQDLIFSSDFQQMKILFNLNADRIGFQKYTARISYLEDEFNLKNNEINFYVEVIDGRQKILLAYDAPHPDIGAVRYVIENNKNYEVDVKNIEEVSSVSGYDLIIAHNYNEKSQALNEVLELGAVPALYILGEGTDMKSIQQKKIGISGFGGDNEELGFGFNPGFKEILLSPKLIQTISSAPPLHGPMGNYRFSTALDVLAYRKIGNIQLDQPLIYFTKKGGNRTGVITGEGIWRWRLYDQLKNGSTLNFEELISKLITFLAIKENKDPFRVKIENEYSENDRIEVGAELYNKSFELINEPEVSFVLLNEDEKQYDFHFVRTGDAYELDLGKLSAGLYTWTARTEFLGKQYEKRGTFLVKELKLELLNSQADHRLLQNLSENSGGSFYFPNQLDRLKDDLINREDMVTVVYQEKNFDDLIDYWWLFFLVMLLLSVEWFVRKFQGAY